MTVATLENVLKVTLYGGVIGISVCIIKPRDEGYKLLYLNKFSIKSKLW